MDAGRFIAYLDFGSFADRSCNGTVGNMGTVFITAIHFQQFSIVYNDFHHAGSIYGTAITAEKQFFFHLFLLRDTEAHGRKD